MSPSGRVNVASAGETISALAERCTLFEAAANGRLTTKNALPSIVAIKQAGRTIMVSTTIAPGSPVAKADEVLARPMASAQTMLTTLFSMASLGRRDS